MGDLKKKKVDHIALTMGDEGMLIEQEKSSPDEEGEWTSDWKQVRNDEPELVSHVPSTKTFK